MNDQETHEFYNDPAHLVPAGPARKRTRPMKTAMVAVRFDPAVIAAVKRLTEGSEVTVSSWIRGAVQREEYRQRVKWLDEHRHELEVVPGSGRAAGPRKALRSSLGWQPGPTVTGSAGNGLTFRCQHLSIGNVASASCGICGPLPVAA